MTDRVAAPVHSMPIANLGQREFFLFYDIFVHFERRKITQ